MGKSKGKSENQKVREASTELPTGSALTAYEGATEREAA